jgi:putative ABC transport system ATP-binding protein
VTVADDYIAVEGVSLTLSSRAGPVNILRGVDLAVAEGASVALLGPSGSGKSSLLSLVAGLERPTSGSITIGGTRFNDLSEDALALYRRRRMGIVFQSFHLIPTMTAVENVALPLELAGDAKARAKAMDELERVGLAGRAEHYPAELSGGEQQRVAIARAVVHAPPLLLADEPTGNLDGATGHGIIDILFSLHAERRMTLLLVTHDMALGERCQRIVHMRDGQLREAA